MTLAARVAKIPQAASRRARVAHPVNTGIPQEAAGGLGEEGVIIDDQHSGIIIGSPFEAGGQSATLIQSGRAWR
jgi:hypothetical protein